VAAYFRIPEGNDYHDHFPQMGRSPEIEGVSGLFIVVYEGPVTGLFLGNPGASREPVSDPLCVITPDGERTIYGGVSRERMVLPPGAFIGAPSATPVPTEAATAEPFINEVEAVELARAHLADAEAAVVWGWERGPFEYVYRDTSTRPATGNRCRTSPARTSGSTVSCSRRISRSADRREGRARRDADSLPFSSGVPPGNG
jgi:hypothetical protein